VPGPEIVENLRLEVLQLQVAEAHAAGAPGPEHDVALRELGPLAEEPRRLDRAERFFAATRSD